MTLILGRLISPSRYHRLLHGTFQHLHRRAKRQAQLFGVQSVYLPPSYVDLGGDRATVAVAGAKGWREIILSPSPRIFHNLLTNPLGIEGRSLRTLNGDLGTVVFNESNRWHRDLLHGILSTSASIRPFLPPISPYSHTDQQLNSSLLEIGAPNQCQLLMTARRALTENTYLINESGLISPVGKTTGTSMESIRWILCLPGPPHIPVGFHSPMDWRLYLIRDARSGRWDVPAWIAKCETPLKSTCWPLAQALNQTYGDQAPEIQKLLYHAGTTIGATLSRFMPGIAHFAADFWIDGTGRPFLVDLSGRFRFDWVRCIKDWQALECLTNHPVKFARALQGSGVGKLHVDFGRIGQDPL